MGKLLILLGIILIAVGLLVWAGEKVGLGRLPGDIAVRGERFSFYFPIVTCILISVGLSLLFWFIQWLQR